MVHRQAELRTTLNQTQTVLAESNTLPGKLPQQLEQLNLAAARLGLSFEGVFRQAAVSKGRNRDTAWYAAIDAAWPALRDTFEAWLAPGNFDAAGRQRARLSDLTRPLLKRLG